MVCQIQYNFAFGNIRLYSAKTISKIKRFTNILGRLVSQKIIKSFKIKYKKFHVARYNRIEDKRYSQHSGKSNIKDYHIGRKVLV